MQSNVLVEQKRELATRLVGTICAVAVSIKCIEIGFIVFYCVVNSFRTSFSVDVVCVSIGCHVLKNIKLSAFRCIEWVQPDILIKD